MKKCTLTFNMWIHSLDDECPYFEEEFDSEKCETCKWYKEV